MPSSLHEAPLDLLREDPSLLLRLVREAAGRELVRGERAQLVDANATQSVPVERRADGVVLVTDDDGVTSGAFVVEVQIAVDEDKLFSWPLYVAALHARHRCPTCLVVIALSKRVAAWAARPIETFQVTSPFVALVLGPAQIPRVDRLEDARRSPELAVLSAIVHGRDDEEHELVFTALTALEPLAEEKRERYTDLVLSVVGPLTKTALEAWMTARRWEFRSDFFKSLQAEAEAHRMELLAKVHGEVEARRPELLAKLHGEVEARRPELLAKLHGEAEAHRLELLEKLHGEAEAHRLELLEKLHGEAEARRLEFLAKVHGEVEARRSELLAKLHEEVEELEAKLLAEIKAEERAKLEAETRVTLKAEARAELEAEVRAKVEAETRATLEAEARARAKVEAETRATLEALRKALHAVLAGRGISLSSSGAARIAGCTNLEELERWLKAASTASAESELWETP